MPALFLPTFKTAGHHRSARPRRNLEQTNPRRTVSGTDHMERKIYNALALLTDCAQRLIDEIDPADKLQFNLEFLAQAVRSAEKVLTECHQ